MYGNFFSHRWTYSLTRYADIWGRFKMRGGAGPQDCTNGIAAIQPYILTVWTI